MPPQFILSLFPGLDILGRAFSSSGHTVVRGPDPVTGDYIEEWHGLASHVDGIIAGPPCQDFSSLRKSPTWGHGLLMLHHLLRTIDESHPTWILIENVPAVPWLEISGRLCQRLDVTDRQCGGLQLRRRHWQWWHRDGRQLSPRRQLSHGRSDVTPTRCVTASGPSHRNYAELCRSMGLAAPIHPAGWSHAAKCRAIGNAVTWPMACTMAAAVSQAIAVRITARLCLCGCGRAAPRHGLQATAACRKRMERRRRGHGLAIGYRLQETPPAGSHELPAG